MCTLCPCTLYDESARVCYNCSTRPPRSTHPTCTRCDRQICSEHGAAILIKDRMCHSCMNMQMGDTVPRGGTLDNLFPPPVLSPGPVYIPSYLPAPGGRRGRIKQALVPRPPSEHADSECLICACTFGESSGELTVLACAHLFHVDCIVPWIDRHPTCPLCRHVIEGTF
jgi:hypothetical protein